MIESMHNLARKYRQVTTADVPTGTGDLLTIMATHCRSEFVEWITTEHPELVAALTREDRG